MRMRACIFDYKLQEHAYDFKLQEYIQLKTNDINQI